MVAREEEEREEGTVQKGRGDCGIQDLRYARGCDAIDGILFFFLKKRWARLRFEDEVLICLQVITNERGYVPNTRV
jgi:hypothetical protein